MTTEPLPLPDECWPIDTSCCSTWEDYDESVQNRAAALAVQTLRMLTGYRVGGCPVTVRPCKQGCVEARTWGTFPVGSIGGMSTAGGAGFGWTPTLLDGAWINMACGCGMADCSCGPICEVALPPPVGDVTAVFVDGLEIDADDYRIDNGNMLVRTDGDCWPECQDMAADPSETGTFAVTYLNAVKVDGLGSYVAGVLACEYAKSCMGQPCALPSNVTRVARQGVNLDLSTAFVPNGLTGIREVDAWIKRWNPNALPNAPVVWSPDVPRVRSTTWP